MAIKGKGKSKARSGRVVTAGPRPAYVPTKVPLFQRTGAKFLLVLIIEAIVFSLIVGFGEQSQTDRQEKQIEEFTSLVQTSLSTGGSAVQALPTGAIVLPELSTRLASLSTADAPKPEDVAAETAAWTDAVTRVADGLAQLEVPQDLEPELTVMLVDARNQMERGLRLYGGLATETAVAAEIEGDPQATLIQTIQEHIAFAGGLFDSGFQRLQEARRLLGLTPVVDASAPGIPGGLPGGVAPGSAPGFEPPIVPDVPVEVPADDGGGGGGGNGGGNG